MSDREAAGPSVRRRFGSAQQQRKAYLEGHRRNPLTMTRLGGRLLSAAQLPWFHLFPPRGFGVLTTTGRKTGKPRHRCVRAIRDGEKVFLVSLRGDHGAWMYNIRSDPRVELRIRGGTLDGRARELTDQREYERARAVYCGTVNALDRIEYRLHRPGRATPEAIKELHEHWFSVGTPVVIDLS